MDTCQGQDARQDRDELEYGYPHGCGYDGVVLTVGSFDDPGDAGEELDS
jgi:hypothetical protein